MHSVPREQEVAQINSMLKRTHENIVKMRLFGDTDQEESLVSKDRVQRVNRQHIDQAVEARQMIERAKLAEAKLQNNAEQAEKKKQLMPESSMEQLRKLQQETAQREQEQLLERADQTLSVPSKIQSKSNFDGVNQLAQSRNEASELVLQEIHEQELHGSLAKIDLQVLKNYFSDKLEDFEPDMTGEAVYLAMAPLYELTGVTVENPLIKKYKNCIYFGEVAQKEQSYQGFLIFSNDLKVYCGQLINEKKHGSGIEIDFKNNIIYEGHFTKGRKDGVFKVTKPDQTYIGHLKKGEYSGKGKLTSELSEYVGDFAEGMRHGQGQETFKKMNLTLKGTFVNNTFSNHQVPLTSSKKSKQSKDIISQVDEPQQRDQPFMQNKVNNPEKRPGHIAHSSSKPSQVPVALPPRNYQEYDYQFQEQEPVQPLFQVNAIHFGLNTKRTASQRERYSELFA